jgi:hypothetical protein
VELVGWNGPCLFLVVGAGFRIAHTLVQEDRASATYRLGHLLGLRCIKKRFLF